MAGDTSKQQTDADANSESITAKTVNQHGEEVTIKVSEVGSHETKTSTEHGKEKGVFPPFDPSTYAPQLFWLAISFGALYLLMSKIALPRIGEILEVRRDRIEGDLAEAERLRQKTEQAIKNYEEELASAKQKAHEIAEATRLEIKAELDEEHQKVEAELTKKLNIAEAKIKKTKQEALSNVDEIAAETLVSLIAKISNKISIKEARDAVKSVLKG